MQVELIPGIVSVSGTLRKMKNGDRIVAMTRKAATTNPEPRTRMYFRTAESYQRKNPPTAKEIAARELFTQRRAYVEELIKSGKFRSSVEAWKEAKKMIVNHTLPTR